MLDFRISEMFPVFVLFFVCLSKFYFDVLFLDCFDRAGEWQWQVRFLRRFLGR